MQTSAPTVTTKCELRYIQSATWMIQLRLDAHACTLGSTNRCRLCSRLMIFVAFHAATATLPSTVPRTIW